MDSTEGFATYAEQWTTEVYSVPISAFLMKRIVNGLKISNVSKTLHTVEDKEQFIELLRAQSNSIRVLSIFKQREQRLLSIDDDLKDNGNKEIGNLVTAEISHLASPEDVSTLSIEDSTTDKVIAAISKMMRDVDKEAYRGMKFMNYLQAVKVWGLGKRIFD